MHLKNQYLYSLEFQLAFYKYLHSLLYQIHLINHYLLLYIFVKDHMKYFQKVFLNLDFYFQIILLTNQKYLEIFLFLNSKI